MLRGNLTWLKRHYQQIAMIGPYFDPDSYKISIKIMTLVK